MNAERQLPVAASLTADCYENGEPQISNENAKKRKNSLHVLRVIVHRHFPELQLQTRGFSNLAAVPLAQPFSDNRFGLQLMLTAQWPA